MVHNVGIRAQCGRILFDKIELYIYANMFKIILFYKAKQSRNNYDVFFVGHLLESSILSSFFICRAVALIAFLCAHTNAAIALYTKPSFDND